VTTKDKVEIRVNRLKASLGALFLIGAGIFSVYMIDFHNFVINDIILLLGSAVMWYCSYHYFIRRILMGPIITLTRESLIVKKGDTVHTYRWTFIKKTKVEEVTTRNSDGSNSSHTMLTVWSTIQNTPDEFHISDLEKGADEIRELIGSYTDRKAADKTTLQSNEHKKKIYSLLLDDHPIGTTELEHADPPMGVVFGNINFTGISSGYDFLKNYCLTNNIETISDYPEDKLIATGHLANLKVVDQNGIEIKGQGTNIEGMDADVYTVTILGVPYPFFEEEFPHHCKAYDNLF
jgi:hypothetical protein